MLFLQRGIVYNRTYLPVRRHKNQNQVLQVQQVAQAVEIEFFSSFIKSTVSLLHLYLVVLVCYLPYFFFLSRHGSERSACRFKTIFSFLMYSCISWFLFESCNLLLEDETYSTRCHQHILEHISTQEPRITRNTCIGQPYIAYVAWFSVVVAFKRLMYITTTADSLRCR